jgi:hypothetical protein
VNPKKINTKQFSIDPLLLKDEIHPYFVFLSIIHSFNEKQCENFNGIFVLKVKIQINCYPYFKLVV